MEVHAPSLPAGQVDILELLLASHYCEDDLPEDLMVIVVKLLKQANRWFPAPGQPGKSQSALPPPGESQPAPLSSLGNPSLA